VHAGAQRGVEVAVQVGVEREARALDRDQRPAVGVAPGDACGERVGGELLAARDGVGDAQEELAVGVEDVGHRAVDAPAVLESADRAAERLARAPDPRADARVAGHVVAVLVGDDGAQGVDVEDLQQREPEREDPAPWGAADLGDAGVDVGGEVHLVGRAVAGLPGDLVEEGVEFGLRRAGQLRARGLVLQPSRDDPAQDAEAGQLGGDDEPDVPGVGLGDQGERAHSPPIDWGRAPQARHPVPGRR
jgi:hypothetical protein